MEVFMETKRLRLYQVARRPKACCLVIHASGEKGNGVLLGKSEQEARMNGNQLEAASLPAPWFFWPWLALGMAMFACVAAAYAHPLIPLPPVLVLSAPLAALVVGLPTWL